MTHLFISAAHKSSGKTTVSVGLCAALRARGQGVQPFKKGPDYIDPLWLSQAAGRPCYNLDFYTMARGEIEQTFRERMSGADVGLVEGNKGLYDGLDLDGSNSNAALAALLGAPVVLVLDTRGMTRGVAPLILGYQAFDPQIHIAGVILNHVGGSRHEGKLRQVIEHYTDVRVVGAVPQARELEIVERHLGLMPSNESREAAAQIERLGARIGSAVDLDAVLAIAAQAAPVGRAPPSPAVPAPSVRIGIAQDEAFGFYYPGDLEALRRAGAELVPFDTLRDARLPDVDGLFIGGGFPEARMAELEANAPLREAVASFIAVGGPAYAECGGLMYLARSIAWQGKVCRMVGVIPADVVMCERPQGRGYVRLRETGEGPWPSLEDGPAEIAAHEFHYSRLENVAPGQRYAYHVLRGHGIDGSRDGLVHKNLLASYTHLRDAGGNHWTRRFVAHVQACRDRAAGRTAKC
jgi:cobyrinic acid a,c-diamide synthase